MPRGIRSVIFFLFWGATPTVAQLPPEILADSHLLRAEQAVRDGDPTRARSEIDKIILLKKEHELNLPEEFHFRSAKVAAAAGLPDRALEAVVEYLAAAGRDGARYVEALELMNQAQDEIAEIKAPQAAAPGPPASAPAAGLSPIEAQSGTGKTPDIATENQGLINRAETAEAQPAPECDLSAWNTHGYFETATTEGVNACLAAGADPNARNDDKETPLHWAARRENPAAVEALLAGGADPNARDDNKYTPLHWAARNKNLAVLEALLAGGADLMARSHNKYTPLHWAAMNENPAAVEALLAGGADPNARDKWKNTPLDIAKMYNSLAAIEILRHPTAVARARRKAKSGPGWLEAAIGIAGGTAIAAGGGGSEEARAAGTVFAEGVISGRPSAGGTSGTSGVPAGNLSGGAVGGRCEIPDYPRPANVQNLGLSWCPATVDFQVRSLALQAAGAQCAIVTGSSSTPIQIQARRQEIQVTCARLAALGVSNCRCP